MAGRQTETGYFGNGVPYKRIGAGARLLVVFEGLAFENAPRAVMCTGFYRLLTDEYTVYGVLRRPNLPEGCTLGSMADDYAEAIADDLGGPVDVIGLSTGGSIAQHFAADHPELVRRLVIHSSACRLSDEARRVQLQVAELAERGRWRAAYSKMLDMVLPRAPVIRIGLAPLAGLGAAIASLGAPRDPSDLVVTIRAEDQFDFRDRLGEIRAPTLVTAGEKDPFYSPELFRETANGIPSGSLALYEGMGHPARGKRFRGDLRGFLAGGASRQGPSRPG
jgi:pimeloyl-ACP methyl ester carboxylesterase